MTPIDADTRALLDQLERSPYDDKVVHDVWSALVRLEQYAALAFAMEKAARRRGARGAELFFRVGDMCRTYLKDFERAAQSFERAATVDPKHVKACAAARAIYLKQRRYARAAAMMTRELAAQGGATERAAALRELALANGEQTDLSNKVAVLEQLASEHPKDEAVARALADLHRSRADAPGGTAEDRRRAARILGKLAGGARGEERVRLAEAALEAWGGEEAAFAVLEAALVADRKLEELATQKLAFVVAANAKTEAAQRARRDLAEQYRAEGKLREAIEMLTPLLPHDPYVARSLQELYQETGQLIELDALLATAKTATAGDRGAVLRQRADIARQRGDTAQRLSLLRELLALDPTDGPALAEATYDCRARAAWAELRDLMAAASRVLDAPADVRRGFLREVAALSEERLGELPEAIDAWTDLARLAPGDREAHAAIERLLARTSRWPELAEALDRRAAAASDAAERRAILLRVVEVKRDRQNDLFGALAVLEKLAALDPADEAIGLALFDAKMWAGDTEGLTDALRQRAESATVPQAAARWAQLARRLEQTDDEPAALEAWRKVRTLDPSQGVAWQAESALLDKLGKKDALLAQLLEHAASAVAAAEKGRLPILVRAVKLALELGDAEKAVAAAEQASEWAAQDDEVSKLLLRVYALADGGAAEPEAPKEPAEPALVVAPPPLATDADAPPPSMGAPGAGADEAQAEADRAPH